MYIGTTQDPIYEVALEFHQAPDTLAALQYGIYVQLPFAEWCTSDNLARVAESALTVAAEYAKVIDASTRFTPYLYKADLTNVANPVKDIEQARQAEKEFESFFCTKKGTSRNEFSTPALIPLAQVPEGLVMVLTTANATTYAVIAAAALAQQAARSASQPVLLVGREQIPVLFNQRLIPQHFFQKADTAAVRLTATIHMAVRGAKPLKGVLSNIPKDPRERTQQVASLAKKALRNPTHPKTFSAPATSHTTAETLAAMGVTADVPEFNSPEAVAPAPRQPLNGPAATVSTIRPPDITGPPAAAAQLNRTLATAGPNMLQNNQPADPPGPLPFNRTHRNPDTKRARTGAAGPAAKKSLFEEDNRVSPSQKQVQQRMHIATIHKAVACSQSMNVSEQTQAHTALAHGIALNQQVPSNCNMTTVDNQQGAIKVLVCKTHIDITCCSLETQTCRRMSKWTATQWQSNENTFLGSAAHGGEEHSQPQYEMLLYQHNAWIIYCKLPLLLQLILILGITTWSRTDTAIQPVSELRIRYKLHC